MGEEMHKPEPETRMAAEEVLREFEDAETRPDDGEKPGEAADALSPSEEGQESVRDKH